MDELPPQELIDEINSIGAAVDVQDPVVREHVDAQVMSGLFSTMIRHSSLRAKDFLRAPELDDVKVIASAGVGTVAIVGAIAYADDALRFSADMIRSTVNGVKTMYDVIMNQPPVTTPKPN